MIERSLLRLDGMKKLIFDLLDLTRIESGQKQRVFSRRRPARAGDDLDRPVPGRAAERGITIDVDCPDAFAARRRRRDRDRAQQPRLDAVKYNRDGGRVDVRAGRDGEPSPSPWPTPASA